MAIIRHDHMMWALDGEENVTARENFALEIIIDGSCCQVEQFVTDNNRPIGLCMCF